MALYNGTGDQTLISPSALRHSSWNDLAEHLKVSLKA